MPQKKLLILFLAFFLITQGFTQEKFSYSKEEVVMLFSDELEIDEIKKANELREIYKVYVGDTIPSVNSGIPSILGKLSLDGNRLVFKPIFPFRSNTPYNVVFKGEKAYSFEISELDLPQPELINISPSSKVIPANQLKIYLFFSAPMREGFAYKYVKIKDESGEYIENPFVQLQPELWDETHTRLTLWLDPGRIKRGLASNEKYGEILKPNQKITIEVNQAWHQINGSSLKKAVSKAYRVGEHDWHSPIPSEWDFRPPTTGNQAPVFIEFGESMDRALLIRCFSVLDENDYEIAGTKLFLSEEKGWSFIPNENWKPGNYRVKIDAFLEDLAGNNLNRPFDRDLSTEQAVPIEKDYFYLPFTIDH